MPPILSTPVSREPSEPPPSPALSTKPILCDLSQIRTYVDENSALYSVIDIVREVGGHSNPTKLIRNIEEQLNVTFAHKQLPGTAKETPMATINHIISIIDRLPGDRVEMLRTPAFYNEIKSFLVNAFPSHDIGSILQPIPESWNLADVKTSDIIQLGDLEGLASFSGEIRRTREKPPRIAAFDILSTVGGYANLSDAWETITAKYGDFGAEMWAFPGKERYPTPVITVPKMIELINVLNSTAAIKFRQQGAKTLVRYLGGDVTLIKEIKAINEAQQKIPENHPMRVFGEHVEVTESRKRMCSDDDDFALFKERCERRKLELEVRKMEIELLEREERVKRDQERHSREMEILNENHRKVKRVNDLVVDGPALRNRVRVTDVFYELTEKHSTKEFNIAFGEHLAKMYRMHFGKEPETAIQIIDDKQVTIKVYYDRDFVKTHMRFFMENPNNRGICVPKNYA